MDKQPLSGKRYLHIALGLWVAGVMWNWFFNRTFGDFRGSNFLLSTLLLPWPVVMVFGFQKFSREEHWWWVTPVLAMMFFVFLYLALVLPAALPLHWERVLPWVDPRAGEAMWDTIIYAWPFALIPVGVFMLWPREPNYVVVEHPECSQCGYDLRGSAHSNVCPECGRTLEAGVDYPLPTVERAPADEENNSRAQEVKE